MKEVTVLIYETDQKLIDMYITELKHTSYNFVVNIVPDLQSFFDNLKKVKPHLVLLSARISGLGEILLGLHHEHNITMPLILIGEREREQDFRVSIRNGAYDYISLENSYRLTNSARNALELEILKRESSNR